MYSLNLLKTQLAELSRQGISLSYYSIDASLGWQAHLESVFDYSTGRAQRELTPEEQAFITNEITLSKLYAPYWLERYAKHKASSGRVQLLRPNLTQKVLLGIIGEMEDRRSPLLLQLLKLRQLGCSTLVQLLIAHRTLFYPNTDALVGSNDPDKTLKLLNQYIGMCYLNLPWWMCREQHLGGDLIVRQSGEVFAEFLSQNSAISWQHGTQTSGIARGGNPQIAHLCLHPDSLIRVQNGDVRKISEVKIGDEVITSFGEIAKVRAAGISPRIPEMGAEIRFWGNAIPLQVSKDHPVLTKESGFVHASKLKAGDQVLYPVRAIADNKTVISTTSRYRGWNWNKGDKDAPKNAITKEYELSREFGWLVGFYLAEGSVDYNQKSKDSLRRPARLILSIHQKEVYWVLQRLRNLLPDMNLSVRNSKDSLTAQIRINDNGLASWFDKQIGHAKEKSCKDWFYSVNRDFCLGILEGYIQGDGYIETDPVNAIITTSSRASLALGIRDLVAALKLGWGAIYHKPASDRYGRRCQDEWRVSFTGSTARAILAEFGWAASTPSKIVPDKWEWEDELRQRIAVRVKSVGETFIPEFWYLTVDHPLHDFATIHCTVKNTELPDYANPRELVEGSLMNAVHEDSFTLFVLESTAAGRDDWWHKFWKANEKLWGQGKARFRPIFLPWYLGRDVWPPPGWVEDRRERGILANYRPSELTIAHAERARKYVASKEHLRNVLGAGWTMPLEQMAYWEFSREYAIEMDSVKQWLQEVGAADADECFQSGATQIFPYELIAEYRNRLPVEVKVYAVESEHISARLSTARAIDTPIAVEVPNDSGPFRAQLTLIDSSTYPELDPNGKLFVWEEPIEGYTYSLGYDAAGGRGGDNVSIEVIRHATPHSRAVQVAEWCANNYTYHDAWPVLLAIAQYYSTYEQARIIIELAHNGNEVQDELLRRGWKKFYQRYSIQGKERRYEGLGWKTTHASRPRLTDTLIKAIKDQWFDVSSPWLIQELTDLEPNETLRSIRIEARAGSKDDRAINIGMLLSATHGEVAPTSQNLVVQRLMRNLESRAKNSAITPSMVETSARGGEQNRLLSFGTPPTIAPNEEMIWGERTERIRSNL